MPYLNGDEATFRGLGDVPSTEQYVKGVRQQLEKAASDKVVDQLKKTPAVGPVLGEALRGTSDPLAVVQRAKALAGAYSTDKVKQAAYQLFYSQSRAGLNELDAFLSMNPQVAEVRAKLGLAATAYTDAAALVKKWERARAGDASAIADTLNLVKSTAGFAASLISVFGQGDSTAAQVFQEGAAWAGVASACAAGVGAGGVGAVMGCGLGALKRIFGYLKTTPPPPDPTDATAMAVFRPEQSAQLNMVALDAMRLAALLRYRYGVATYRSLQHSYNNTSNLFGYTVFGRRALDTAYPPPHDTAPTGYTPWDYLCLCARIAGSPNPDRIPLLGHKIRLENNQANPSWGTGERPPYWYGDVPAQSIAVAGYWTTLYLSQASLPASVGGTGQSLTETPANVKDRLGGLEGATALIADEILNFFAATSRVEIGEGSPDVATYLKYGLPVRYWYVASGNFATDPRYGTGTRYDPRIWTLDQPCGVATEKLAYWLSSKVLSRDPCALKEFALIRVVAALSYMHMMYKWGPGVNGVDMIADLPAPEKAGASVALRTPVNPRSVFSSTGRVTTPSPEMLEAVIRQRKAEFQAAAGSAAQQAEADHAVRLAEAMAKAAPTAVQTAEAGAMAPGAGAVSAWAQQAACTAKGGRYVQLRRNSDGAVFWYCQALGETLPSTVTVLAVSPTTPVASGAGGGAGDGAGAIVVAGGIAALLALLL